MKQVSLSLVFLSLLVYFYYYTCFYFRPQTVYWLVFVNLGRGNLSRGLAVSYWPVGKSVDRFSWLMTGGGGPRSLWWHHPRAGGPKQTKGSKPVRDIPLWPLFQFLSPGSYLGFPQGWM